jgi:hypothetical protein
MRLILIFPSAALLAALWTFAPGRGVAQAEDSVALQHARTEFTRLRADLDRVNAEIAALKQADRSVRDDYQLRDRMADAEALAQKVTRAEARLRSLGWTWEEQDKGPLVGPPQALPQDGSVELEAKAGLFADQARKLEGEATVLAKAAEELRSRKALRRRAGDWDRDPFMGLEGSKRSLAVTSPTQKSTTPPAAAPPSSADSASRGTTGSNGATTASSSGTFGATTGSTAKRLYLDPTTATELRHALGTDGATSDPDALDHAATILRTRARALNAQAQALLVKSQAP